MKNMTIKQKAAQLSQNNYLLYGKDSFITGIGKNNNITQEYLDNLGSVLNFRTYEQVKDLKELFTSKNSNPPLFMMDVIHGCKTIFPIPLGMACSWNLSLVEKCCSIAAKESLAYGVDVTFSPMVDLVRDPRWGRVAESYGEDQYLNGLMGIASIKGYQNEGVSACVKHYCAYGAAEAGKDYNYTDLSEQSLRNYYLKPYQMCVEYGVDMVMSSFNNLNGTPVNGNKHVMVDILRNEWKYDGVVISDYCGIQEMVNHHFAKDEKEAARIAINNQIDIEMFSDCYYSYLDELVKEQKVSEETINNSLRRFENLRKKHLKQKNRDIKLLSEESLSVAKQICDESIVLLKNEDNVLPLKKNEKVCFLGPHLNTKDLFGTWPCYGEPSITTSIKEELEAFLGRDISTEECCGLTYYEKEFSISDLIRLAIENSEKVVLFVGESSGECGESRSKANPSLSFAQQNLIKEVSKYGKPIILVFISGRPLIIEQESNIAKSILYTYFLGSMSSKTIVETLYGFNNPSGKITMTFPRSIGQIPVYYNDFYNGRTKVGDDIPPSTYCSAYIDERIAPLYPFGFGLSYSSFEYSSFVVKNNEISINEELNIEVVVENTSDCDGWEIVEVYYHDCYGSIVRPKHQLVDFKKIFLKKHEKKVVKFSINCKKFSFYNNEGTLLLESGDMKIYVGGSSDNLLEGNFKIV